MTTLGSFFEIICFFEGERAGFIFFGITLLIYLTFAPSYIVGIMNSFILLDYSGIYPDY
jgi:hypothetical protein